MTRRCKQKEVNQPGKDTIRDRDDLGGKRARGFVPAHQEARKAKKQAEGHLALGKQMEESQKFRDKWQHMATYKATSEETNAQEPKSFIPAHPEPPSNSEGPIIKLGIYLGKTMDAI